MTVGQCLNLVDELKQQARNQVMRTEMNELTTPTLSRSITTTIRQVSTTQESDPDMMTVKPTSSNPKLKKLNLSVEKGGKPKATTSTPASTTELETMSTLPIYEFLSTSSTSTSTTVRSSSTTTTTTTSTTTTSTKLTTTTTTRSLTSTYVTTTEVTTPLDFICLEHTFISWDGFILTPEECHAARQVLSETSWVSQRIWPYLHLSFRTSLPSQ